MKDLELITQIAERAVRQAAEHGVKRDLIDVSLDLSATHAGGCPLRLEDLLIADDFTFARDVIGIARHLDRTSGALRGCFVPRYADLGREEKVV